MFQFESTVPFRYQDSTRLFHFSDLLRVIFDNYQNGSGLLSAPSEFVVIMYLIPISGKCKMGYYVTGPVLLDGVRQDYLASPAKTMQN